MSNLVQLPKTETAELAPVRTSSAAIAEIQAAVMLARQFPRDVSAARDEVLAMCRILEIAEKATYRYSRGKSEIIGPSTWLMRSIAQCWGNLRFGYEVVSEDDDSIHIKGFAWDLQRNTRAEYEDTVKKVVQRVNDRAGVTEYRRANEREIREVEAKSGAILTRNALIHVIPRWLTDEAKNVALATVEADTAKNRGAVAKAVEGGFAKIGITRPMLEEYLGHPLSKATDDEVTELRQVFTSIREGVTTWLDYAAKPTPVSLKERAAQRAAEGETKVETAPIDEPTPTGPETERVEPSDANAARMHDQDYNPKVRAEIRNLAARLENPSKTVKTILDGLDEMSDAELSCALLTVRSEAGAK